MSELEALNLSRKQLDIEIGERIAMRDRIDARVNEIEMEEIYEDYQRR